MYDAIAFVQKYEVWFYVASCAGILYQSRRAWQAQRELAHTLFGLEREAALGRRSRALFVIFTLLLVAGAVFSLVTFVAPALSARTSRPGGPGANPTLAAQPATSGLEAPTPALADGSGCVNPAATITEPAAGQVMTATVQVRGTAAIVNFAFYKLEISGPSTGDNWNAISAGNTPVQDDQLGAWDSRLYSAGSYALRLVVFDVGGVSPPPCVVPIVIARP